jgi:hypothetical protein
MAKLLGPLMSFDARGQLGKMLVYSGWKGIKTARTYVVPANPKAPGQVTQRGYMTAAVESWHDLELNAADVAGYKLRAAQEAKPMSGFNSFVKAHVAAAVAGEDPAPVEKFAVTVNTGGTLTFTLSADTAAAPEFEWGYAPGSLLESGTCTGAAGDWTGTIGSMVEGTTIYIRFVGQNGDEGCYSGIYKVVIAA